MSAQAALKANPGASMEFTIPALPVSLNQWSRNWKLRPQERERWAKLFLAYAPRERILFERARVTLTFYGRCDADNCAKSVLDQLKRRFIVDDSYPALDELVLRQRPGEPRTDVRVERVA